MTATRAESTQHAKVNAVEVTLRHSPLKLIPPDPAAGWWFLPQAAWGETLLLAAMSSAVAVTVTTWQLMRFL
jgi:hypothetical protein